MRMIMVSYVDQLNPIERQNYLVNTLGIQEDVFLPVTVEQDGGRATVDVETSAHLYACLYQQYQD